MKEEIDNKVNSNNKNNTSNNKTYKEGLWMYFYSIKEKFLFDRAKAKSLLYIISQKNSIEYEYSENLKCLYNQFKCQYDSDDNSFNNKINIESTLNASINALINNLKYESELYSAHSRDVFDTIIKPMESFIMNQYEINYELIALMESYEKEFKLVNQILDQKENIFHNGGKSVEVALNKLEQIKNKNLSKNKEDIFKLEEDGSDEEFFEKYSEMVKNNSEMAKLLQIEYLEYLKKANEEREKYIKLCEHIYDQVQNLDEEFIKMMKNQLKLLIDKEINLIENINNNKINIMQFIEKINIENDINSFINSKLTKFYPPRPFQYIEYNQDMFLRAHKEYKYSMQNVISLKIMENLKQLFKYEKPKEEKEKEDNLNFINDTVNEIWDGNNYNKNKVEILFKEHIYRLRFLQVLNQFRVEGIFILQLNSFQNFCMTLSSLLDMSVEDEDYECIKLCMILSQTFYLQDEEKKVLLQFGISLNKIWHEKKFWENIIEYSISDEINFSKGYMIFLEEDYKLREKRVESSIISNLITFLFNMKLFGYSEKESRIIIDEFIDKYKIDGSVIYATELSLSEIKDDIIVESVENATKNDIKEENQNKFSRKNTNNSKTDEKNTSINTSTSSRDNK